MDLAYRSIQRAERVPACGRPPTRTLRSSNVDPSVRSLFLRCSVRTVPL